MIRDLNLEHEIPLLHATRPNRDFSYDPILNGPFETTVNGAKIFARESSAVIIHGKIIQR